MAYARLNAQLKPRVGKRTQYCDAYKRQKSQTQACTEKSPDILVLQHYMRGPQARHSSLHTYHGMHSVHSIRSMHVWSNLLSCCDLKQSLYAYSTATRTWSRLSTRLWRDGRGQWRLCHQQRQKRKHSRPAGKQTKPACCTSLTSWAGDVFLKPCSSSLDRWFHWHQEHHCSGYYADWVPFTVYHREHCVVV